MTKHSIKKIILAPALIMIMVSSLGANAAYASPHPYVAGHQVSTVYNKLIDFWMHTNYSGSTPSKVDCGVYSVASAAGGSGTATTGWIYQAGSYLLGNGTTCPNGGHQGDVFSSNQVNFETTSKWDDGFATDFGAASGITSINQTAIWQNSNSQVEFEDLVTHTGGSSTLYGFQYTKSTYGDTSSYFMAGTTTNGGNNIYLFQFGAESALSTDYEGGFNINQNSIGFTDATSGTVNLSSKSATAVEGGSAYVTYDGSGSYLVGGQNFNKSNKSSSTGSVTWYYDASNSGGVSNGASLW